MAVIVEDYVNRYAFTITLESLGPIRVWHIEGRLLVSAIRQNFETRKHIEGYPFVKALVSKSATHLNMENERKEGEPITAEEAETLSPEEAEQVAEEIIKRHEYLFEDRRKPILKQLPPDEQGSPMAEISEQKLDFTRNEEESASDYLYRLVLRLSEREEIDMKAAIQGVSEMARKFTSLPLGFTDSLKLPSYNIAPPRNPQHTTNEILKGVLNEVAAQKELYTQLVRSNEVSSRNSSRQVRLSNIIAFLALLIALIGFLYTYYNNRPVNQTPPPQVTAPASSESPQGEMK